jgi:hypothetical protein
MIFDTFNNVSVIYHSFALGRGSGVSCFMPLSILFQSFTTLLL